MIIDENYIRDLMEELKDDPEFRDADVRLSEDGMHILMDPFLYCKIDIAAFDEGECEGDLMVAAELFNHDLSDGSWANVASYATEIGFDEDEESVYSIICVPKDVLDDEPEQALIAVSELRSDLRNVALVAYYID
jgi:hypothetical protein